MLLEGLIVPVLTPFYPDGRVYLRKLEHNVERYSRTPAAALALLTPAGETDLLSDDERLETLRHAAGAAADTRVLLADCTRPGVRETLRLLEAAASLGFDAAIIRIPAGTPSEQQTFARAVADGSALPFVLNATGLDDAAEDLLVEAAHRSSVLGAVVPGPALDRVSHLLERTADISRDVTVTHVFAPVTGRMLRAQAPSGSATFVTTEALSSGAAVAVAPPVPALRTRVRRVGFQLIAGSTAHGLDQLRAGARAWMPAFAAAAPQATYEVYAAWKDDDQPLASEKLERVVAAAAVVESDLGVSGLKAASDLTGYFGGRPRLPHVPLHSVDRARLEQVMRPIRH